MASAAKTLEVNAENQWRLETPHPEGWERTPRPDSDKKKYFICSVDSHITPPLDLIPSRIDEKYRPFLPRIENREDGQYSIMEGRKPFKLVSADLKGEDMYRAKAAVMTHDTDAGMSIRLADMDFDGIDAEVCFPNGPALSAYQMPTEMAMAAFRIYNDWATEVTARYGARCKIVPTAVTSDIPAAIAEIERVLKLGADIIALPTDAGRDKPQYNHKDYDPLWAVIEEAGIPIAMHVATGDDPRRVRGPGGAIMNRAYSHEMMVHPIVAFCSSGVLDRFPNLRCACVEGGVGWIPALLDLMDETYKKHHFWCFPKLKQGLPSDYFRSNFVGSFQEDRAGTLLVEPFNLENNFCWSNDYPHHEGTWPHSAAAIERDFAHLREDTRAKILGLNAARFFNFTIPEALV